MTTVAANELQGDIGLGHTRNDGLLTPGPAISPIPLAHARVIVWDLVPLAAHAITVRLKPHTSDRAITPGKGDCQRGMN